MNLFDFNKNEKKDNASESANLRFIRRFNKLSILDSHQKSTEFQKIKRKRG
jgi:hypothetical protein